MNPIDLEAKLPSTGRNGLFARERGGETRPPADGCGGGVFHFSVKQNNEEADL